MRMLVAFVLLCVLGLPSPARADSMVGPGECGEADAGCGCTQHYCNPPLGPDLSMPRDLSMPPRDLLSPGDEGLDACRERRQRRQRAHGRGLVLLSGLSALAVLALRRRYRTNSPTPAENALAARATRSDS
ncbi:MAG TPA: hypothetical protein VN947_16975 [Polyangia bacterium]|nr:hypothetical protein [Polyangia bacterium]